MKRFLGKSLLLGMMAITSGSAIAHAGTDDIIFQNRVDSPTLDWIINKTQIFILNETASDYLSGTTTIDNPPTFSSSDISTNANFIKVQSIVSQVFGIDASKAILRLRIPTVSYKIHKLTASPNSIQLNDPMLTLDTNVSIAGADVALTGGLQMDLMVPNPKTGALESYVTASLDPTSVSLPDTIAPATFEVKISALRDQKISFKLDSANLDSLPGYVHDHQQDIIIKNIASQGPITADQIHVNPVTVKLGPLSKTVSFDEFKPLIQDRLNAMIGSILYQIGDGLKTSIGPTIISDVLSNQVRSDFQISNAEIFTRYQLAQFSEPAKDQASLSFSTTVCPEAAYAKLNNNCESQENYTPARVISDADHEAAKAEFTQKLETGIPSVGISVSEEYLNHLLRTSIDANMWTELLKDDHLQLGEKGVFLLLNQASTTPDLVLDLEYFGDGSLIDKILIQKPLHFPLRFSTSISFENRSGIPYFVVTVDKVLSTADEIINGIPSLGLSSKLITGLKKKVANTIISMGSKMDKKKPIETDLPVLKNMGVETITTEVSQYGRLNLYIQQ